MPINKKLIHFKKGEDFDNSLKNGDILDTSIVFIKDRQQIYTHGQLYNCPYTKEDLDAIFDNLNSNIFPSSVKFIDLGLPSGTLWADRNLGATSPEDFGLYFQWGDTQGYTKEQIVAGEKKFSTDWSDYKYADQNGNITKYNGSDKLTVLEPIDDAAVQIFNENSNIPTYAQYAELLKNTDKELYLSDGNVVKTTEDSGAKFVIPTVNYGNNVKPVGIKFVNRNDSSKYILMPFAGIAANSRIAQENLYGCILCSTGHSSGTTNYFIIYNKGGGNMHSEKRLYGYSIRSVKSPEPEYLTVDILSQAEYDSLTNKSNKTLYIVDQL